MKGLAKSWLGFANEDRIACERLLDTGGIEGVVAFHAQQVVEKSLKAVIVAAGSQPPRVHDLTRLLAIAQELAALELPCSEDTIARVDQYYTLSRYPQSLEVLGPPRPSHGELAEMVSCAADVYAAAKSMVGRGLR